MNPSLQQQIKQDLESFPKYWMESKHDKDGDVRYYNDKIVEHRCCTKETSNRVFYKDNNIDVSQNLLNNIKNIKPDCPKERLFIHIFSKLFFNIRHDYNDNIIILALFNYTTIGNIRIMCVISPKHKSVSFNGDKIFYRFKTEFNMSESEIIKFLKNMCKKYLNINNYVVFDMIDYLSKKYIKNK